MGLSRSRCSRTSNEPRGHGCCASVRRRGNVTGRLQQHDVFADETLFYPGIGHWDVILAIAQAMMTSISQRATRRASNVLARPMGYVSSGDTLMTSRRMCRCTSLQSVRPDRVDQTVSAGYNSGFYDKRDPHPSELDCVDAARRLGSQPHDRRSGDAIA